MKSIAQSITGKFLGPAATCCAAALLIVLLAGATPARASLIGLTPSNPDVTAALFDLGAGPLVQKTGGLLDSDPLASLNVVAPLAGLSLDASPMGVGSYFLSYNAGSPNTFTLLDFATGFTLLAGDIIKVGDAITVDGIETFDFLIKLTSVDAVLADAGFRDYAGITLGPTGGDYQSDIFSAPVPVPEPCSFLLVAAGLIGVAALRRRIS